MKNLSVFIILMIIFLFSCKKEIDNNKCYTCKSYVWKNIPSSKNIYTWKQTKDSLFCNQDSLMYDFISRNTSGSVLKTICQ